MKRSDIPQSFAVPFGAKADSTTITTIPRDKPATGRASMTQGFSRDNGTPLAAGGVPPYLEDMNGILNMLSVAARASEMGVLRPFSQDYANSIGGYPKGAIIAHPSDDSKFLICTMDYNSNNPAQNMFGWSDILTLFLPLSGGTITGELTVDGFLHLDNILTHSTDIRIKTLTGYYLSVQSDGNVVFYNGDDHADWALSSAGGYIGGNKIALVDDVHAEASRAQSAEANLISGTLGLGAQSTPGRGLHTSGTGRANYVDDTGSRGDLAYYTDVQNETARAQNIEAKLLPRGNPMVDGTLYIQADGVLFKLVPNDQHNGQLRGSLSWGSKTWWPGGDGVILTPNGGKLLESALGYNADAIFSTISALNNEISRAQSAEAGLQPVGNYLINAGSGNKTRKVVSFNTTGKHGTRVTFPEQFSSDDVQISIATRDTTEGHFHIANYLNIDRSGFLLSLNVHSGGDFTNETTEIPISIIAIGHA